MCAGAIIAARIKRLVYGARDPKGGADGGAFDLLRSPKTNHRLEVSAVCWKKKRRRNCSASFAKSARQSKQVLGRGRPNHRVGEVVEWLKAPASKAGERVERSVSSNLTLSARILTSG